jgi:hypothetical protein
MEDRNEFFTPPTFDPTGGRLGVTPILWQLRMAYTWSDQMAEEYPDWDQCCTCHVFALSEGEALARAFDGFTSPAWVMPEYIASCHPVRFRNQFDDEVETRWAIGAPAQVPS